MYIIKYSTVPSISGDKFSQWTLIEVLEVLPMVTFQYKGIAKR